MIEFESELHDDVRVVAGLAEDDAVEITTLHPNENRVLSLTDGEAMALGHALIDLAHETAVRQTLRRKLNGSVS